METLTDYGNGIVAIDSGYLRPRLAAIHLIESEGRAAFVDTANHSALPRALAALQARGLTKESVDYVILTHIHLDHAGAAGLMMDAFPNARLVVHPRGARHMADPAKLMAGVEAVYGKERATVLYGELRPVAPERIIEASDGTVLRLGRRELLCIDTPGHAKHHIAIVDRETAGIFTGDTFGISYREFDVDARPFIFPSTTPSQFDPVAMRNSVAYSGSSRRPSISPTTAASNSPARWPPTCCAAWMSACASPAATPTIARGSRRKRKAICWPKRARTAAGCPRMRCGRSCRWIWS